MSDIVLAVHPAYVRAVPARSREARESLVRVETPVRLRELDPSAFSPRLELPSDRGDPARRILLGPDGPWEEILTESGDAVGVEGFREWLSDALEPGPVREALDLRLDGTPLASHGDGRVHDPSRLRRAFRGEPDDTDASRRLVHDGREDARAHLAAFLGDDVAVAGGRLVLRSRPLALVDLWATRGVRIDPPRGDPDFRVLPTRPEGYAEAAALARDPRGPSPADLAAWLALERCWPDEREDVRWALNAWSGPMRRVLDGCLAQPWMDPDAARAVESVRDDLRQSEVASWTGMAGRVSLARPLADLVRGAALAVEHATGRVETLGLRDFHARLVGRLSPRIAVDPGAGLDLPARIR